jgi:4-amino-4-deoxy-L-arabinose transferase-like glycosyltransferase
MNRKLYWILGLALLVRIFTFGGYVGQPDEITNVEIVQEILGGSWPKYEDRIVEMVFPTRIGYLGVMTGLVGLLGVSELSYTLYSLLSSLATLVVVFLLGRRWLGEKGGLWAALLFSFFPLDLIFATKISSDPPLTFFCTLSVYLFFKADEKLPRGRRALTGFLAGCAIGFALLHKVTAGYVCIFFAVVGVVDMIRRRRVMVRYVALALGFLLLEVVEMGFQYHVNQDPLYQWHVYDKQAQSTELRTGLHAEERVNGWKDDVKRLCWTFPLRSLVSLHLGLYYWLIFPAVGYALLFRRKDLWAPLVWWILVALLLNLSTWGGGRLPFYSRQLFPLTVPGVILLAAAFLRVQERENPSSPAVRKSFQVLLAVLSLVSLAGAVCFRVFQGDLIPLFARFYSSKHVVVPEKIVVWFLEFFFPYMIVSALVMACFFVAMSWVARRRESSGNRTWPARVLGMTVMGFLAISSVSFAYLTNRGIPDYKIEKAAWEILRELPPKTIYADWYTKKMLDFHSDFRDPGRVVDFRDVSLKDVRDGYLVYNAFRKDMEKRLHDVAVQYKGGDSYLYPYDSVDEAVREDWEVVGKVRDGLIIVYRIPGEP